ncbi:hypothetical protein SAMN05444007_108230 [Cribrihabitans marinus]|uniref:Uncharacterized protein n=1 Tax=Cribrihabitans marinus TaxID=1227549 RepID=A0A1H7CNQ5_9RHOB|nr:hypothetical protein [Cribrihabitans marinus]GGH36166.1 hypothetical protein GCM10010973_29980 [Cribrihabitans marinus]SEJ91231.1 hypothetical protein SAMN05444007_108230 [Cribrihabitans marinus]
MSAMSEATEKAHRALIAAEIAALPDPPVKWCAEYDLALVRCLLSGGGAGAGHRGHRLRRQHLLDAPSTASAQGHEPRRQIRAAGRAGSAG